VKTRGKRNRLEHAHRCCACEYIVWSDEIDMIAIATGVITCPKCGTSGSINLQILKYNDGDQATSA
jgi:hypothetical protein